MIISVYIKCIKNKDYSMFLNVSQCNVQIDQPCNQVFSPLNYEIVKRETINGCKSGH